MTVSIKIYLPMSNRPAGYCATMTKQKDLARRFGMEIEPVRERLHHLQGELLAGNVTPQPTANRTKKLIDAELNAAMQTGVRAR